MRRAAELGPPGSLDETRRLRAHYLRLRSALYDQLTGLCSYHLHLDHLESQARGRRLGVIVLEFPTLAALEAAHGWEVSDRFLAGVASHLGALKGRDLPGSALITLDGVHGNTFPVFLWEGPAGEDVTGPYLAETGTRLSNVLDSRLRTAPWAPEPAPVDFNVGHALVRASPSARFERMVHQAIREARGMTVRAADRLQRERALELSAILREGRLTTHYQPIVDMEQGAIIGYEALTRGPRNTPFEVPKVLFSCSHDARLAAQLDASCRLLALRNARGLDPGKKLFLNSLAETLGTPGFMEHDLRAALEEVALQPRNVVLEITERTAIEDFEAFGRELDGLRRLGFLVAIDDVGTGYASLQAVSEVQADFLKIDISLIKNIHQSLIKQDLVHSLLQVAARTRSRVIAEGIESAEEYRTLRACGVRYGQGFYFAPPAPEFAPIARGVAGSR
ncbi:MAG: EAL domain-containing protein [Acidobacteria bacterium]|nr:EAL domain-containing protein [Acidobacteriota bacterium]